MSIIEEMRARLDALSPASVMLEDESALHAGHAGAIGGGGHYRLHIVSNAFTGHNTVSRHRMIYNTLGEMMNKSIHALAIRAQTAEEASTQLSKKEHQ